MQLCGCHWRGVPVRPGRAGAGTAAVEGLLASIALGYGVMLAWDVVLLYRYFPQSDRSPWLFLQWLDQFMPLALTGLFTQPWVSLRTW